MQDDLYTKGLGSYPPEQAASPLLGADADDPTFAAYEDDGTTEHHELGATAQQDVPLARKIHFGDGAFTLVDAGDYPFLSEFNWSRGSHGDGRNYVYRYE